MDLLQWHESCTWWSNSVLPTRTVCARAPNAELKFTVTFSIEVLNARGFPLLQSNLRETRELTSLQPEGRCLPVVPLGTYGCCSSITDWLHGKPNRWGALRADRPRRGLFLQPPPSLRGLTSPILSSDRVVLPSTWARGAEWLQPRWSLPPGPGVQGSCISGCRSGTLQAWLCARRLCCCGWRK